MDHQLCKELHKKLSSHALAWPFLHPVDPVALNLPTYFDIIKNPMDLSTMKAKLKKGEYMSPEDYKADMILMFENAIEFNKEDTREESVGNMAKKLLVFGLEEWETTFEEREIAINWSEELERQLLTQLEEKAIASDIYGQWKKESFVAKLNRSKIQQRLAIAAQHAP